MPICLPHPLLSWLAFAAVGFAVTYIAIRMLTARGRPGLLLAYTLPIVAVAPPAYLMLTPRLGSLGVAVARTALTVLSAIVLLTLVARTCRVRPSFATMWRAGLTSSIVYVVSSVWQTSGLLVVVELLLLSAGIVASLVLLGELTRRDIELATSLLLPPTEPPRVSERRTS